VVSWWWERVEGARGGGRQNLLEAAPRCRCPHLVVYLALLRVLQHIVGLVDLLELLGVASLRAVRRGGWGPQPELHACGGSMAPAWHAGPAGGCAAAWALCCAWLVACGMRAGRRAWGVGGARAGGTFRERRGEEQAVLGSARALRAAAAAACCCPMLLRPSSHRHHAGV